MRRSLAFVSFSLALLAIGCGAQSDDTPVACLEGAGAYLHALARAPGEVTLADGTPISGCLVENQAAGELATVGKALLAAATKLDAEARAAPGGVANLRLGYLLGATAHGAEATDGIHTELVRRLTAAARYSPGDRPLPAAFRRAYGRGYEAGAARG